MKHYVFWTPEADTKLQRILGKAPDPPSLIRVLRDINNWLIHDPGEFGESRYENVRVAIQMPIGIQFEVLTDPPTAIVFDVWHVG